MKKENKLVELKKILEKYFVNDSIDEWIDIEIINSNIVDIIIVSDKAYDIKESERIINEAIDKINLNISTENSKFSLGYLELNTVSESKFLDISKPIRRKYDKSSFGNLIDFKNNYEDDCIEIEERINKSRIITFYSYKGGVGRTIALIQTAYLLAKKGKKVLLMDLDIEAPSFYNIFRDVIKMEDGLVDYLYEELYDGKKIQLSEIISKLNLNLKGEIYIVSTGITDLKYVQKLEALKEKRIYENKYIQKLIRDAEINYGINYTLIDARTGINKWGALSIIDIADEVMLFAYPNKENISGLSLILDIIADCKKTTIVLSRIDSSNVGQDLAKKLFDELELKQEYIGIYYDTGIAVSQKYPAEANTDQYKEISEFLLEEEMNTKTNKYINDNRTNVKKLLKNIYNINSNEIILEREYKLSERSNWIIVKSELDKLNINFILRNDFDFDNFNFDLDIDDFFSTMKIPFIVNDSLENVKDYLKCSFIDVENVDRTVAIVSYIMKMVNDKMSSLKDIKVSSNIEMFKNADYIEYIHYFNSKNWQNEINKFNYFNIKSLNNQNPVKINCILYFEKILSFFETFNFKEEDILSDLLTIMRVINSNTSICVKIILNNEYYLKYQDTIDLYNANKLNLAWDKLDKLNVINDISETFQKILYRLDEDLIIDIYNNLININIKSSKLGYSTQDIDIIEDKKNRHISENKDDFCNIIYGKRINPDVYSKTLTEWIYTELKKNNKLNKEYVINLIKQVSKLQEYSMDSEEYLSNKSFVSFVNFEKAIKA